jgi:muramidase (phage lysozyme)
MARISVKEAGGANVCAFLDMLAFSELGRQLLSLPAGDDGYRIIVGSTPARPITFANYADHPRQSIVLNAGLRSTAAGRYQFLAGTWDGLARALKLRDFSPVNQDHACIELLRQSGALPHVVAGTIPRAVEIAAAIQRDNVIWASLPGSPYNQRTNKLMDLLRAYGEALARYESAAQALGVA